MKTKTITTHAAINHGAFFQAFALQQTLSNMGIENEILNVQSMKQKHDLALFRKVNSVGSLVKNVITLLHYSGLKERNEKFKDARTKNMTLTKEYVSLADYFKDNPFDGSLFIAGSDQIWNTQISDYMTDYMLPGVPNKITYSVSGGANIHLSDLQPYLEDIKLFKHISVRETDLKQILEELGIKDVLVTLDPTLLISRDYYQNLISDVPFIQGKYIFLYSIKCDPEVLKAAKRISKRLHIPVYTLFNNYRSEKNRFYGLKTIYNAGPEDFLNIIQNAELVLSDSFHGNVFSVILEKKFYYISPVDEKGDMLRDDRIDCLLTNTCLSERKISVNDDLQVDLKKEIDYKKTVVSFEKLRKSSLEYLKNAICE